VMQRNFLAELAENAVGIQIPAQPVKTGRIVREQPIEIVNREFLLLRLDVVSSLNVAHEKSMRLLVPTVKG
jgi:hypothetical protein